MNPENARDIIVRAIVEVAPEVDVATIAPDEPLQEQLDLDSMDFQAILTAVAEETGLDVPERDYDRLATLSGAIDYLVAASIAETRS